MRIGWYGARHYPSLRPGGPSPDPSDRWGLIMVRVRRWPKKWVIDLIQAKLCPRSCPFSKSPPSLIIIQPSSKNPRLYLQQSMHYQSVSRLNVSSAYLRVTYFTDAQPTWLWVHNLGKHIHIGRSSRSMMLYLKRIRNTTAVERQQKNFTSIGSWRKSVQHLKKLIKRDLQLSAVEPITEYRGFTFILAG